MSVKLSELAVELGLELPVLKQKLAEMGVSLKASARTIDDISADLARSSLAPKKSADSYMVVDTDETPEVKTEPTEPAAPVKAKAFEDYFEKELDREIIKSQRKMTAGKDTKVKKPTVKPAPVQQHSAPAPVSKSDVIEIPDVITVKEFAEKSGINAVKIIGELMKNGVLANINQSIDYETASIIADDFKIKISHKRAAAAIEDISSGNLQTLLEEKDQNVLETRPPVVTIMGHVDHGKTSLLDAIRETSVASGEAGGITQHIGAYQIDKNGKKITFIDTPGHEAFTSMRARGAKVTDIVILVVAADDGPKPQTIEALNHALAAEVPIIVAINKIDKEGAQVDKVKAQMAEHGLNPEEWGGNTIYVPVSAKTRQGLDTLLDMILLTAEVNQYKANSHRPAVCTVLESHVDKSLGSVATVLINTGTLRPQDSFIVGKICGRVKLMRNDLGQPINFADPSMPVLIAGLEGSPQSGDILQVVGSMDEARAKAGQIGQHRADLAGVTDTRTLEYIMAAIKEGRLKSLKIVLKADTIGTLEALKLSVSQIHHEDISVKIIHGAVGDISESDVMMAAATPGVVVIGFNADANHHVRDVADRLNVQIFTYNIIYKLIEDLKKILTGMLEPDVQQVVLGRAEVRAIFLTQRKLMIVGCKVISGKLENRTRLRVFRDDVMIGEGMLGSLKKNAEQVHEINEGAECGIRFEGDVKLQEKDVLESWKEERRKKVVL